MGRLIPSGVGKLIYFNKMKYLCKFLIMYVCYLSTAILQLDVIYSLLTTTCSPNIAIIIIHHEYVTMH